MEVNTIDSAVPVERVLRLRPRPPRSADATVTVVIPCYNYARFLPAAIGSVLAQQGVAVDVVVVDDASTDDSLAVAHDLARRDPRVSVIAHAANAGPVQTFNDGLAAATGEFLVRLDADDLLTPGALQRAVAVMQACPTVGLVYGHPLHFSGDHLPPHRDRATRWTLWPGKRWLADRCRSGVNVITSPEVLMRRSVVGRVGGQQPLDHTHDMEMWLRIAAFADIAYIQGADQAWHREHAQSLSARKVDAYRDLVERRLAFEVLFNGMAGGIADAAALHAEARRAIAREALLRAVRAYDRGRVEPEGIEALVDFALSTAPEVRAAGIWSDLQRRQQRGQFRASRYPGAFVGRAQRWLANAIRWRRWHRHGVF